MSSFWITKIIAVNILNKASQKFLNYSNILYITLLFLGICIYFKLKKEDFFEYLKKNKEIQKKILKKSLMFKFFKCTNLLTL